MIRKKTAQTIILFLAIAALFCITLSALFLYPLPTMAGSGSAILPFLYRFPAALIIFFFVWQVGRWPSRRIIRTVIAAIIVAFVVQIIFLLSFYRPVYTDTGYVMAMAGRLIDGNHHWFYYFYEYPNNVNIVIWWSWILKPFSIFGFHQFSTITAWLQMIVLDIGIIYLSLALKKLNKKMSLIFLLLSLFYLPWFMYALFPYNDVIAVSLIMIIIASFIYFQRETRFGKKLFHGFLLFILFGLAVGLRQNSIIILIALLLTILLASNFNWRLKSLLVLTSFVFVALGIAGFNLAQQSNNFYQKPSVVTPSIRYVNMSWNPHTSGEIDNWDSFLYSDLPKKERSVKITAELKRRLEELGFVGIIRHAVKKIAFMFSYGFSNEDMGGLQIHPPVLKNEWKSSALLDSLGNLFQPIYLFILSIGVYGLFDTLKRRRVVSVIKFNISIFSAFSILGIFTFHILLWEVRDRYALPLVPFFLILAVFGINRLLTRTKSGLNNKFEQGMSRSDRYANHKGSKTKVIKLVLGLSLLILSVGGYFNFKQSQTQVNSVGYVYQSGFSLYTENGHELFSLPAKTTATSSSFNLKNSANYFSFDFSGLSAADSDQVNIVLLNRSSGERWVYRGQTGFGIWRNHYTVGEYQLLLENKNNHRIKIAGVQNLETQFIQGPTVSINNQEKSGLNLIFTFADQHSSILLNPKVYTALYVVWIILAFLLILNFKNERIK